MMETMILKHQVGGQAVDTEAANIHASPGDPTDLEVRFGEGDASLIEAAIAAARGAACQWQAAGIERRSDALQQISRTLREQSQSLAMLIARETGKTLRDALAEVVRASRIFDFFAAEALRNVGEKFESVRVGASVEVAHQALGVIGIITPWNFPVAIPAWKIAPALAFGNAVVWKPSELASATAAAMTGIIQSAGLPAGTVNLVLGGSACGETLCNSAGLDALTFTGSEPAGRRIRQATSQSGIRLQQEMGGVNGLIVLADAHLETAAACAVNGAYFAAGQRCTATSRIIVADEVADALISRISQAARSLVVGDPRDAATDLGPLASKRQQAMISRSAQGLVDGGYCDLLQGGAQDGPGAYFRPMLFDHVRPDAELAQKEIFGPVAGLFRVKDYDEALAVLNNTPFGLAAGICTTSLAKAEAFKLGARAGMLMVNLPTAGVDYHAPFGGVGSSSYGLREQGRAARAFYTQSKTIYQQATP
jgi:aldehyde dehydrogenase (NAD+)